jgi:hypothetical protein
VLAGHRGDAAFARAHVSDADAGVREAALGAMARCGALSGEDLERALDDAAMAVRRRAIELAAARRGDEPPSLLAALADDDAAIVEVAAWASGERAPAEPGVVPVLATIAVEHEDALCREAAVAALGAIGDDAGLPAVLAACGDKATVRRRAVLALAPFTGPDVDAALARASTDRDAQVRQAAEDVSGR